MIIIGITGSIGMGKSTLAAQCLSFGAKVCSSDEIVHRLLGKGGGAVSSIAEHFPQALKNGEVDRKLLGKIVFTNISKRQLLESIVHPLVREAEEEFAFTELKKGARTIVFDIPLLFETNAEKRCDLTIVATAPVAIQRQRVLLRPNMSEEKFRAIVASQMPDREKQRRCDIVIHTGLGKAYSFRQLQVMFKELGDVTA